MRNGPFWKIIFLFLFFPVFAQGQNNDSTAVIEDILATNDGIILRGKIIRKEKGVILFRDNTSGEISIKNSRVLWSVPVKTGQTYRIITYSSSSYLGKLISAGPQSFLLETSVSGEVAVPYNSVKTIELVQAGGTLKNGPHQPRDPVAREDALNSCDAFTAHYVVTPNAIPAQRGEYYLNNFMVLGFTNVNYAINDHLVIGGGLGGAIAFPYLHARTGFHLGGKSYIGGHFLLGSTIIGNGAGIGGMLEYTYGHDESNISLGIGYGGAGMIGNGWENPESPLLMIGGMTMIGNRAMLVSENWIVPQTAGLLDELSSIHAVGLRILNPRGALDIGISGSPVWWNNRYVKVIPYGGYTYRF